MNEKKKKLIKTNLLIQRLFSVRPRLNFSIIIYRNVNNLSQKKNKPKKGQKKGRIADKDKEESEEFEDDTGNSEYIRVRLPRNGEILGVVIQILGADRIQVRCMDGKTRTVRIPGKYRKRLWTRQNDIVSVLPWYGLQEDTRADLVYRYNRNQADWLEKKGYIKFD